MGEPASVAIPGHAADKLWQMQWGSMLMHLNTPGSPGSTRFQICQKKSEQFQNKTNIEGGDILHIWQEND